MENKDYKQRVSDTILQLKLRSSGAVCIKGPKWCGKTWTALHAAQSVVYMQDADRRTSYMMMAHTKPSLLLQGEQPRLIDEWQDAPVLWDAVRFAVDQNTRKGQFILTGSVTEDPDGDRANGEKDPMERAMHTGTGRITEMRMRTMSLFESGESNGAVSLKALFDGEEDVTAISHTSIEDLAFAICRGGWPATIGVERDEALEIAKDYVEAVCKKDASSVDGSKKDPDRMMAIIRSLSRNISTMTADKTIIDDVKANDLSMTDKTLEVYLRALRKLYLVENVRAWQPSLRSKTAVRTSEKRQFVDPSIAVAALGAGPEAILDDFKYFGFLFESLCVRDLRVYAEPLRGVIKHYHDRNDLEIDLIITLADGRWAGVEVKLGSNEINEGADNLKKLASLVDEKHAGKPSFLMVLTGGEFAYRRPDGVYVVPIGCLKD